jgi:hypothetical protein
MTQIYKCDRCGNDDDESQSLLYKIIGSYADERQDLKSRRLNLNAIDLCNSCMEIVQKLIKNNFKE